MEYAPKENELTQVKGMGDVRGFYVIEVNKKDIYTAYHGHYIDQLTPNATPTTIIMPNSSFSFIEPTKVEISLLKRRIIKVRDKYLLFLSKIDSILEKLN